ncbi:hypothetical protein HYU94_02285 [Candidatus Daviesbacteria bacterium]|nr:hypothetical protein [Candidatus Daviesbacteria bacterium]
MNERKSGEIEPIIKRPPLLSDLSNIFPGADPKYLDDIKPEDLASFDAVGLNRLRGQDVIDITGHS